MWILPSRGRPESVKRFFIACAATGYTSPGILYIDNDDPCRDEYLKLELPHNWDVIVQERVSLGELSNNVFRTHTNAEWFGMAADDIIPHTQKWDARLINAAGRDGIAFGNDGINGDKLATHPVIGGDFARELGFICLPGTKRIYMDTAWTEVARRKGVLRYLPDVHVEHLHFSNGKSQFDETYAKPDANDDKKVYLEWLKQL
jgi:hypothetical protein